QRTTAESTAFAEGVSKRCVSAVVVKVLSCGRDQEVSPVGELHLIEPYGVIGLSLVAIHLEGDIDFLRAAAARRVGAVEIGFLAVDGDGNELRLPRRAAVKLQHQVVPLVGGWRGTPHTCLHPAAIVRIVNVPGVALEGALGAENELLAV